MKLAMALMVSLLLLSVRAEDAVSRHNEGGSTGSNGVKQVVAIKINKTKVGTDSALIQVDLGVHRYDSSKPDVLINQRPVITIAIGSVPVLQGTADAKGVIKGDKLTAKLVANGAGMKITIKKADFVNLLSDLSGKGEHVFLTITIGDGGTAALLTQQFEMDVDENSKKLLARGG